MAAQEQNKPENETVVLLHGILKSSFDMALIGLALRNQGYNTINISYPSRRMDINAISEFVNDVLSVHPQFNNASKVHFVTHSMGGLVTRYFLHKHRPANLGRVVMLSPPNKGSEFANWMMDQGSLNKLYKDIFGNKLKKHDEKISDLLARKEVLQEIYKRVFGPAGAQLRTDHTHSCDPKVDFPLGVIAGNACVNPLAPWVLGKDSEHDGIVPVERMKIDGMKDMIALPTSHMFMVFNNQVRRQVIYFLKNEQFDHPPAPM